MRLGERILRVASARVSRRTLRRGARMALLAMGAVATACDNTTAPAGVTAATPDGPSVSQRLRIEAVDQRASADLPRDVWMGTSSGDLLRVRVFDASGAVYGAAVRFQVVVGGAQNVDALISRIVHTDTAGVASIADWQLPVSDTVATLYRVIAQLLDSAASATPVHFALRAWRDLRAVGDASTLVLTQLPIAREAIHAIRPLGTFANGDALPSADAIIIPIAAPQRVGAMSPGVITDIDWRAGAVTVRTRDAVRVRLGGLTLRSDLWIGKRVAAGDSLGAIEGPSAADGLRVRVLDGSVSDSASASVSARASWSRPSWIRPERYGARVTATFFGRYFPSELRSVVYSLVRRAAPDLDGRFGYDQSGRLVGTWFDPTAPVVAQPAPTSSPSSMPMDFSAAIGELQTFSTHRAGDVDPSDALGNVALTFAYDAERPGQVRIATGAALARTLGLDAVQTVAWEDPDPAAVHETAGAVGYHLYASDDEVRLGRPSRVLLVQVLGSNRVKVEVIPGDRAGTAAFTARAIELVR
ncbi:MAG: hypothetical protein IT353_08015 [Gemmatimonadaceae bacterium]|nr:hypothetical protein [Gemmatimonadaceae bacterium]